MHGRSGSARIAAVTAAPVRIAEHAAPTRSGAVAWIDRTCAIVARTAADGSIALFRIEAGDAPLAPFLGRVTGAIGDRERVQVLGSDAMRIELEREYVAIYRRPERLVDVGSAPRADEADLVRRLEQLTAR